MPMKDLLLQKFWRMESKPGKKQGSTLYELSPSGSRTPCYLEDLITIISLSINTETKIKRLVLKIKGYQLLLYQ